MGLFSFFKKAGANVLGKKKAAETAAADAAAEARQKLVLLKGVVESLELPVENMELSLEDAKVSVSGTTPNQETREKVILALGNVEGIATVEDHINVIEPADESKFYEVKSGDTLSKIAKEVYGDAMKYPVIFEANKPMLASPDLIYPGQSLRIPAL